MPAILGIGLNVKHLRKNEVEAHIKAYPFGNRGTLPKSIPNRKNTGDRDVLSGAAYIVNYVSDKTTKNF